MMDTKHLEGKTAVVSGATAGIGLYTAIALAQDGAYVIGVGRDAGRCTEAEKTIRAVHPEAQVHFLIADLSRQRWVRKLAQEIQEELGLKGYVHLDILVNNAGIYSSKFILTEDGVERTIAVNHIAPLLLTHELFPVLTAGNTPRVITVSSASHYHTCINVERLNSPLIYHGLWAYKVSKLANVLFTFELNRRYASRGLRAFAVDPGLVNTEIGLKETDLLARLVWNSRRRAGTHPEVPARTILYLSREVALQNTADIYWKDSRPIAPSRHALDAKTAYKLWVKSCRLCSIPEDW